MSVLCLVDDKDTMKATNTINLTQRIEHELLITLHVVCINLNKKVIVTAGVITFSYLINILYDVHKLLDEVLCVLF